jgi:acyl carrier protein
MFEQVKQILMDELQIDANDITMEAELIKDLGINSLELADLVCLCEEKFDIEIKDEDIHQLITVGNVVDYLNKLSAK